MEKVLAFVASLFQELKLPVRWVAFITLILTLASGAWFAEYATKYVYFTKLERKILLLKELQQVANSGIQSNPELYPVYKDTANELAAVNLQTPLFTGLSIFTLNDTVGVTVGKAIGGASLWIIILLSTLSSNREKGKKSFRENFDSISGMLFISALFGWVGTMIPTFYNPWVNYVGFPLLQVIVLFIFSWKAPVPKTGASPEPPADTLVE